eukprot:TRINITY_DN192_c0_g1_i2.p1 TRINITY_DN192_c0_g1~~TRINITY_DN192_c0_g1_i2.p1  ORF type:complete len:461 (+),score=135.86 TRINITY_DN192_c0_g1_i2:166-1548(+)
MACMNVGQFTVSGIKTARLGLIPNRNVRRNHVVSATTEKPSQTTSSEVMKTASYGIAASALFACGNAYASQEVLDLAASDNRFGVLALLALPALGWVAFNIAGPALNQLDNMSSKKMIPVILGLSALFASQQADAATQIADLAASDNRFGVLALLALPALGWVAFNIAGPALNQLDNMSSKKVVPIGLGLGAASLFAAEQADAAAQIADLAASDNRFGVLALLALPALGWVAFNIAGPALNQLDNMSSKKMVPIGLGLGAASLFSSQQADAATQIADLAASDNRFGVLTLLALPALGWVAFNIAGPALNQLDNMSSKKMVPVGLGLGAASLFATQQADAATQFADLAASDNRFGVLTLLALPALGWVAFNIAGPALNQLDQMSGKKMVPVGVGLGAGAASLFAAQQADAASQIADLAASDNRFGLLLLLAVPAVGWVAFNILGPALNQLDNMGKSKKSKK